MPVNKPFLPLVLWHPHRCAAQQRLTDLLADLQCHSPKDYFSTLAATCHLFFHFSRRSLSAEMITSPPRPTKLFRSCSGVSAVEIEADQLGGGQSAAPLWRKGAFAIEGVVHINYLSIAVRPYRDASPKCTTMSFRAAYGLSTNRLPAGPWPCD